MEKEDCISSIGPCAERDQFRLRPFVVATLVALVAAGLSVQALLGAVNDRGPRIRAVRAKADAHVSAVNRTQNFGRAHELKVDAAPTLRTYVSFDVDLKSGRGRVKQVSLLLYSQTRSQAGYQVRLVAKRWGERKITFANAPTASRNFVRSGPLRAKAWQAVDITDLVSDDHKYVSFVLTTVSPKGVDFASRETKRHGPRLVVEREDEVTTSTSTTTTGEGEAPEPR
jgi:hypothetical protein